jgi:16S rRNA (guanine527-N7)-methyltransferase
MFPEVHFHLVDSIAKKLKVIEAVIETLHLKNVTTEHSRMEKLRGSYELIVSRAVARAKPLCQWTQHLLNNHKFAAWMFLKGGDLKDELRELAKPYALHTLSDFFDPPFFATKQVVEIPA